MIIEYSSRNYSRYDETYRKKHIEFIDHLNRVTSRHDGVVKSFSDRIFPLSGIRKRFKPDTREMQLLEIYKRLAAEVNNLKHDFIGIIGRRK